MSLDGLRPPPCPALLDCIPATKTQQSIFYLALYGVAIGIGGISPCLSPFGADQFNEDDEEEKQMKRSFFNYWGIAVAGGGVIALSCKQINRAALVIIFSYGCTALRKNYWRSVLKFFFWPPISPLFQLSSTSKTLFHGDGATQSLLLGWVLHLSSYSAAYPSTATSHLPAAPWQKLHRCSQLRFWTQRKGFLLMLACSMTSTSRESGMFFTPIH